MREYLKSNSGPITSAEKEAAYEIFSNSAGKTFSIDSRDYSQLKGARRMLQLSAQSLARKLGVTEGRKPNLTIEDLCFDCFVDVGDAHRHRLVLARCIAASLIDKF